MFADIPFNELAQMVPFRAMMVPGCTEVVELLGPGTSKVFTRHGQIVGCEMDGRRHWHYRGAVPPRWTGDVPANSIRISEPWLREVLESISNLAVAEFLAMGEAKAMDAWGFVPVTTLDSVSSGNCLLGTVKYVREHMPHGFTSASRFMNLPEMGWDRDRIRAVSFAIASHRRSLIYYPATR